MSFFVTLLTIAAMAAAAWFFGLIKFDEPAEDAAPAAASPSTAASKGAAAPSKPDETKGASGDVDASAEEDADEYINVDTAKVAQEMAEDERRAAEVTAPSLKIEEQQQSDSDNTDIVNDESPAVEEVLAAPDVQEQQEAKPASSSAPVEEPEPAVEPTSAPIAEEKVEVTLTGDRDAATPSPPASPPAVGDDDDSSPASPAAEEKGAKDKKKKKTARRGHV